MNKIFRWIALILSVILIGGVLALAAQNQTIESFHIFHGTLVIPEATANFGCLLVGVLSYWLLSFAFDKSSLNVQKKKEWQAQDAKLMSSIASDKEKLLEAKIATLEAALKNALKKQN